ncbi:protein bric-a-brac 1 isoform X2 [Culicoides brevitarsis]|uniref:protein bric-a-brac 1 isoform X2 n=1 Tax=Culicoides brevitarsis TaxID=469753 RepID=UPI00307B2830
MDQQFCLRWNNHPSNLTGCLSRLLKNEALCDVTLVCNDKKFQAHQTILSACSPYLEEIFLNNKIPHPIVYMIGVGAVEMAALLDFMYQGEVNVAHSLLQKFLNTARILQVRGLTENDSMNFKAEDNDIENNNINNNNSTPKFSTQSVPPSSYDSDREITDKEIKEESEQSQQQHHREHRDSREHRSGDRDRDEEREQRLVSRRSASDRSNRESSTTPVDREQQSSSASLSSYPNKKARTSSVCDTPNMPFGSTQERRSDSGLPPSLGSQKHSPTSKMDASDLDDGRRISPASNASRDHMPLKSDLDLNMPGLHHDIPPQLLPNTVFWGTKDKSTPPPPQQQQPVASIPVPPLIGLQQSHLQQNPAVACSSSSSTATTTWNASSVSNQSTLQRYLLSQSQATTEFLRSTFSSSSSPTSMRPPSTPSRQDSVIREPSPRRQFAQNIAAPATTRKGGRFRPNWLEQFEWLRFDDVQNVMYCCHCRRWCNEIPDIRTSFVEGNSNFRLEIVNHHDRCKAHRLCREKEQRDREAKAATDTPEHENNT